MTPPFIAALPSMCALAQPTLNAVKDAFLAICDVASTAYAQCIWTERQFEGFLANFANAFYGADTLEGQAHICEAYMISLQQRLVAAAGGAQ